MTLIAVAGPIAGYADIVVMSVLRVLAAGADCAFIDALGLVSKEFAVARFGGVRYEPKTLPVDHIVAAIKYLRTAFRRFQQIADRVGVSRQQVGQIWDAAKRRAATAPGRVSQR